MIEKKMLSGVYELIDPNYLSGGSGSEPGNVVVYPVNEDRSDAFTPYLQMSRDAVWNLKLIFASRKDAQAGLDSHEEYRKSCRPIRSSYMGPHEYVKIPLKDGSEGYVDLATLVKLYPDYFYNRLYKKLY